MAKEKIAVPALTYNSWSDVAQAFKMLKKAETDFAKLDGEMKSEVLSVEVKHKKLIAPVQNKIERITEDIKAFALANRDSMDEGTKKEFDFGTVYFKNNPASLGIVNPLKEADVIQKIKTFFKSKVKQFVKVTESIAKTPIKNAVSNQEINSEDLSKMGLELTSTETLHIKTK